jgi:hypothetical protein
MYLNINKQKKKNHCRQTYIDINPNAHIKYMNTCSDTMVAVDNKYKKKLSGSVKPDELSKELDDLLKYYGAEKTKPNLSETKKILSKFNVNEELLNIREENS